MQNRSSRGRYKRKTHSEGYIYLMRCGHLYKVGRSSDPAKRLFWLQHDTPPALIRAGLDPRTIVLVHVIPTDIMFRAEKIIHAVFSDSRLISDPGRTRPEWFSLSQSEVDWFCSYDRFNVATNVACASV